MKEYTTFTIHYYWVNSQGKTATIKNSLVSEAIPPGRTNQTTEKDYPHTIGPPGNPSATGTYYCEANWTSITITGKGVFILFRDVLQRCPDLSTGAQAPSGSSEPSGSIYTLQDMIISQPDRVEGRNEDYGKTGKKKKKKKEMKSQQETLEEPFDTLYENI
ncbi:NFAT activation molecule 1 [Chelonia mydas]|uniref:NFAT activation molecule 1 n=1 Tax=Chelonia mydas TaxID=8469 RepID=M7B8M6_CHEMY|nr:NFAT activation molecule 1 [Chelonia mydas]